LSGAAPWRKRLLRPLLYLLGLNLVVAAAYTVPRGLKRRDIALRAERLRNEVAEVRQTVGELARRDLTVRENEAAEKRFLGEVLGTREATLVPALSEIETLAREPGLKAGTRNFSPAAVKELPLLRLQVGVTLSGGYPKLVEFVRGAERAKHFITVDEVDLRETGAEEGGSSQGALGVQLSAWFRGEAETEARGAR
jgi:Tfp pilus assembly protein PilO